MQNLKFKKVTDLDRDEISTIRDLDSTDLTLFIRTNLAAV